MSTNYKCFSHRECEFYPCHKNADPDHFNCLFCYCPLYLLGTECGGTYQILAGGVKDCSDCLFPHQPENYDKVVQKLKQKIFKPFDKK
ncbi:cysteine-rich small domain-containing protein [Acidaminococcus timonensis]|jgi:Zn-finger protein|uniref:cysteine-rich small domain-containing protein n=1 Tax=Acidaminococcus timonensis TaxID=1871002 RepID=UPI003A5C436E